MEWTSLESWASPEQAARVLEIWAEPHLKAAVEALREQKIESYLVGGLVRDVILGRDLKDVDLLVCCSPRRLLRLQSKLSRSSSGTTVPLDPVRGIVRLCFSGGKEIDLVSLQGETLTEDLQLRDLRINAMLVDGQGRLADPTGGLLDIQERRLRAVASENFERDPLRVLRCLRFAAQLKFHLEQQTRQSALRAVSGLDRVAGERMSAELGIFFKHAGPEHIELLLQFGLREQIWTMTGLEPDDRTQMLASSALLPEAGEKSPLGFRLGLAIFLGPILPKAETRKLLFERLRLSRKTRRYLEHWWDGAEYCSSLTEMSSKQVFQLSRIAGLAFQDLSSVLLCKSFPTALSPAARQTLRSEALGQGQLRWEPMPWSGHDVARALQQVPGPWMNHVMRALEEAWALREIDKPEQMRDSAAKALRGFG